MIFSIRRLQALFEIKTNHLKLTVFQVIVIDTNRDFVLLLSFTGEWIFGEIVPHLRYPRIFESFFAFGLSHKSDQGDHITHRSGRIPSDAINRYGQLKTTAYIDGGDSGAPCFAKDRQFIGILVSSSTSSPDLLDPFNGNFALNN